uniref:Uncharacterized protein n=1 Tax=Astyanax mexicanus TaxID=7994 RepID=A0A3B1K112_ASTMX
MEEAYTALYQQFLRLQSLCLKQAAMLQHLTEALRRQQGTIAFLLELFCDANLAPLTGALHRLQLDPTWAEPKLNNCDQTMPAASPAPQASIVKNLQQVEQRWHSLQTSKPTRRPWSSSFMNSEMLSQAGGLLMSGVMVSSQVCEFCHAVFPGHTTTNGEFLRHLMSHT